MNVSTATAQAIVRGLVRAGVGDFVIAPGSRSAPLSYAIAVLAQAGLLRAHVRIDERDAAFTALGIAKAGRLAGRERPVAVVTTSGSAVGNLHPAVMEAAYAHVPLIVLSADRPARLRGTGANQTLDAQSRSLPEVVAAWDLYVPGPERRKDFLAADGTVAFTAVAGGVEAGVRGDEELVVRAVRTALGERLAPGCGAGDPEWQAEAAELGADPCGSGGMRLDDRLPGPIQLNVQFDVPLVPEAADLDPRLLSGRDRSGEAEGIRDGIAAARGHADDAEAETGEDELSAGSPVFVPHPADRAELLDRVRTALGSPGARAVVVAGDDLGFGSTTAGAFATAHGLPVFAEPSAALSSHPHTISAHAQVLGEEGNADLLASITHVVVSGRPTLSRPIAKLLDRADVERLDLPYDLDGADDPDLPYDVDRTEGPDRTGTSAQAQELAGLSSVPGSGRWLADWRSAARRSLGGLGSDVLGAERSPDRNLGRSPDPGPECASRDDDATAGQPVSDRLDAEAAARMLLERPGVVFAASSNAIRYLAAQQRPRHPARVLASRGLAGIDGLLATASGLALGLEDEAHAGRGGACRPALSEEPVRLLVGDLAALHDLGGLVVPTCERRARLQIVVLNDDGGAIFSGLEHSAEHLEPYFERFFGTPHGLGLAEAARGLGWSAQTVEGDDPGAADALAAFLGSGEPGLFEIRLR